MVYRTRKLVRPEHLNPRGTLFGGMVMKWIDEEAAIYATCQLGTPNIVTKVVSEINFLSPARNGDIVEIGCEATKLGTSSITLTLDIRNKTTKESIVKIEKMVFVHVDESGRPSPHGVTQIKE